MEEIPSRWERWTIDEIGEGVARVLISEALMPERAVQMAAESGSQASPAERARALRNTVMELERGRPEELWTDERDVYLPVDHLSQLLKQRAGKPGLPGRRPLREGDVFWVVTYHDGHGYG